VIFLEGIASADSAHSMAAGTSPRQRCASASIRRGPRRSAIAGAKPNAAAARDPRVVQAVADVLSLQAPVASESPAAVLPWAVDGSHRAYRVRSTPMRDEGRRLVGAVTLLEDITHLSEISRLKSEFIAAASHELRTPLTSVQMGIHLLLEDTSAPLTDRQHEILSVCREDTARLDRLMRELLDLSKIDAGDVAPVRVPIRAATVVRDAAESLRLQVEARHITLTVDAAPDLPIVQVDRGQIERVVGNLVTNAARAAALDLADVPAIDGTTEPCPSMRIRSSR
jgi:NtrC-family two-component system sensor histidine kinase KinB